MTINLALATAPLSLEERYGSLAKAGSTEPSFGLTCLAAAAQRAGANVTIVEASAQSLAVPEAADRIIAAQPDLIGISATTSGIVAANLLAERIKSTGSKAPIVLGGCHVTAIPQETMQEFHGFDIAVIGEGEQTLVEIVNNLAEGKPLVAIEGTATRANGAVQINQSRALIQDLDSLPLPAWSLLEGFPAAFRPSPGRIQRWPCASIVLTRGCPNQCVFCDRSVFGNRCRAYSPEYALKLVRDLRDNYGVKEILIEDDTFIIVKRRVREFCELLLKHKVDITWSCLGRADRVDPDLLKLMKKAGCWHISYGIESGDPEILQRMRKNLDLNEIRQAVQWSREAGMRTKGFFIIGFPGETEESLRKTKALATSLPLDDISVMQMTPFPGSELYDMADQYGFFERDWRRMNAVDTVFIPHGFDAAEIGRARAGILRRFYMRPTVLTRHALHTIRHPRLIPEMFSGLSALLKTVGSTTGKNCTKNAKQS